MICYKVRHSRTGTNSVLLWRMPISVSRCSGERGGGGFAAVGDVAVVKSRLFVMQDAALVVLFPFIGGDGGEECVGGKGSHDVGDNELVGEGRHLAVYLPAAYDVGCVLRGTESEGFGYGADNGAFAGIGH